MIYKPRLKPRISKASLLFMTIRAGNMQENNDFNLYVLYGFSHPLIMQTDRGDYFCLHRLSEKKF